MSPELLKQLGEKANSFAKNRNGSIGKLLGKGGSAAVFEMPLPTGTVALKVYDPSFLTGSNGASERKRLALQRQLIGSKCESLVSTLEIVEEADTCFVLMEYLPWPSLKDCVSKVPDKAIELLITQLVNAVTFLEEKKLVHRDIKPENILVEPDFKRLKLIDLGVIRDTGDAEDDASSTDHGGRRPFIATAQYSSPEYLFRLEAPSLDTWRALTLYQVGGVLHDLVLKKPLFDRAVQTNNKFVVAMSVLKDRPDFSHAPNHLLSLATLAAQCLTKDPHLRLKLVNWQLFKQSFDGSEDNEVRELLRITRLRKDAEHARLEQVAAIKKTRAQGLDGLEIDLRGMLVSKTESQYQVTSSCKNETSVDLETRLSKVMCVNSKFRFTWDDSGLSDIARVEILASFNCDVSGETTALPLCEVSLNDLKSTALHSQLISSVIKLFGFVVQLDQTAKPVAIQDLTGQFAESNGGA